MYRRRLRSVDDVMPLVCLRFSDAGNNPIIKNVSAFSPSLSLHHSSSRLTKLLEDVKIINVVH
jgi:hypothetical protein